MFLALLLITLAIGEETYAQVISGRLALTKSGIDVRTGGMQRRGEI